MASLALLSAFKTSFPRQEVQNLFKMDVNLAGLDEKMVQKKRSADEIMKDVKKLKTQNKYDKNWNLMLEFHNNPDIKELTEEMFLQYFDFLINEKKYAHSTLWSIYSMLNSESQLRCGPKLNEFFRLITLIKSTERGYSPKQAMTFTLTDFGKFLEIAPSNGMYALEKAALIIGAYGGLRVDEMSFLEIQNFRKDPDDNYWVTYRVSKQKQDVTNSFHIPQKNSSHITKYIEEIDETEGRFFRRFLPTNKGKKDAGKFSMAPMGKNIIARIPHEIAKYLNLPNAELYTGHSFRRTSATLFANAGATKMDLKKHLNWKSDSVADRYVDQSESRKLKMSAMIANFSATTNVSEQNCTNALCGNVGQKGDQCQK